MTSHWKHRGLRFGLAAAAALWAGRLWAGEAGIYVEAPEGKTETKLEATTTSGQESKGVAKTMLTGGLAKPKMVLAFDGARADLRLGAQPAFRFRFDPQQGKNSQDPAAMMAMMMGGGPDMPMGAKRPEDFDLVVLEVRPDSRAITAAMLNSGETKPKNATVAFAVEKLGANDFRVRPKQALAAGEYGFYCHAAGAGGRIWSFGVD
jgi:hypothetical protein